MSFLNPVSEPVKRFKSTDAGAPQIKYNARVAGDVKAVLKACLVTGYGAVPSAGWTTVNDVGNAVEFVSPSATMSEYRLCVNDAGATSTNWYYRYQGTKVTPAKNNPVKNLDGIDPSHASNGWICLVTKQGFVLIELVYSLAGNDLMTRVTYFGALKKAIDSASTKNIGFWFVGVNGSGVFPTLFFGDTSHAHYSIGAISSVTYDGANIKHMSNDQALSLSTTDILSPLILCDVNGSFIAKQPAILMRSSVKGAKWYGVSDVTIEDVSAISVFLGGEVSNDSQLKSYGRHLLIRQDYWEY